MVALRGQVPKSDLINPPMLNADGAPCLVVFKNGAKTGMTIGKVNNVSSYTRKYFTNKHQESREWPVIPTNKDSGMFSAEGDSGSCITDASSRIGGILTSSTSNPNATTLADITYVTPISFIMKALHETKRFHQQIVESPISPCSACDRATSPTGAYNALYFVVHALGYHYNRMYIHTIPSRDIRIQYNIWHS